ncbi:MAG: class I SAM-dependent methyltransferase [bacterium]|nr:class I SAM-dependent methyltransferase [bacterium]
MPDLLDFHICPNCGLTFLGTPISERELAALYDNKNSENHYKAIDPTLNLKMDRVCEDLVDLIETDDSPSVLDVGCGYGHLIEKIENMNLGIKGIGLELPGVRAETCKRQGMQIHTCPLSEVRDSFNGVLMLDVAEHVLNPNGLFKDSRDHLKDGGFLYLHTPRRCFWDSLFLNLVRIPGFRSVSRTWLETRVSTLHLHLWTDRALEISLGKAGFKMIEIQRELELSWPLELYVDSYLGRKLYLPKFMKRLLIPVLRILFIHMRTLRNKAICTAR